MKMSKLLALLLVLAMVLALTACGSTAKPAEPAAEETPTETAPESATAEKTEIVVFAAASMTETLTQIKALYEAEHPETTITYNFDSSGTLKTQIQEGADCDLFICLRRCQYRGAGLRVAGQPLGPFGEQGGFGRPRG